MSYQHKYSNGTVPRSDQCWQHWPNFSRILALVGFLSNSAIFTGYTGIWWVGNILNFSLCWWAPLKMRQLCFRQCPCAEMATNHYMIQWWLSSIMHMCPRLQLTCWPEIRCRIGMSCTQQFDYSILFLSIDSVNNGIWLFHKWFLPVTKVCTSVPSSFALLMLLPDTSVQYTLRV